MEAKYIFRNELKDSSMEQWIRKMLEIHDLMNVEELCRDSGCSNADIRSILDTLLQRHEVECLRPVNYENDDMDFFRLCRPARAAATGVNGIRWFVRIKQAVSLFLEDNEDTNDYKHHTNNILTVS